MQNYSTSRSINFLRSLTDIFGGISIPHSTLTSFASYPQQNYNQMNIFPSSIFFYHNRQLIFYFLINVGEESLV